MPSCAPRPVPTISAVGVARPSAHGQAMISTATAAVNAVAAERAGRRASRRASRARARSRPARRPPRRGRRAAAPAPCPTARPRRGARSARAPCRRRPSSRARRAGRSVLTVAPATSAPAATSTGTDSPVSSDWSTADSPSTTTPSVAIFSPGRTTNRSPTRSSVDRDEHLVAVAQHARLLRAELEQLADRLRRAALRARLEVAAEQDQRRDDGGDLEVGVGRRARRRARRSTTSQAASVPSEISVSIVAAPWRALRSAARWKPTPE